VRSGQCPLLAHSGHRLVALHMSAFGGKADISLRIRMPGIFGARDRKNRNDFYVPARSLEFS
jgi:hypothetical protein